MKSSINVRYTVYVPKVERNSATHLNHATRTIIRSDQSSKCCAWREFTRADALGHASIKQHCEIQCEALEFSDEHKWLCDLN